MQTPAQDIGLKVKRLQVRHHRAANAALADLGVSLVQWDALRHLHANPGSSLHDLAVLTFQTDQAFGTLATRLEARGLVERVPGPGKAVRLGLTDEGERVRAAGARVMNRVLEHSLRNLTANQRATFGALLDKLLAED